jgi:hypothetical protein
MAKGWKCARCSTSNDDAVLTCSGCSMIRGSVVPAMPERPPAPSSSAGWSTTPGQAEQPSPPVPWWVGSERQQLPDGAMAPAPSRPLWRRVPVGLLVFVGMIAIGGAVAWYSDASRAPSGEITKAGDITVSDLRVGDCFDLKDPNMDEIDEVRALPCTEEHAYELFYTDSLPEGGYPVDAAFDAFLDENCIPAFATYIGTPYRESELDVFWVVPTAGAWDDGDRTVQCAVFDPRMHRLTGSQKGSAR